MDTTDDNEMQAKRAESAIALATRLYKSNKRRIEELDYWRDVYQTFGWQMTIDLLEAQMIAWGRLERAENMSLYASYTEEMNHYSVDPHKKEWTDEDRQSYGYSLAYARARYAIRFMTIANALTYLERDRARKQNSIDTSDETNYDTQKTQAYSEMLQLIINQMKQLPFKRNPRQA